MTIPCQASIEEGVTTIGSSPSTAAIGTPLEMPANYASNSNFQPFLFPFLYIMFWVKTQLEMLDILDS